MEQAGQDEEDTGITKSGNDEQKPDDVREETKGENPLEKYMKMVLEARERQRAQVSPTHICPELCFWDFQLSVFWVFFRALEEKKNIRAQRQRVCLRRKTTGN